MFFTFNVYDSGTNISRFPADILASLYAGASFQLRIVWIGESSLCVLVKHLIVGEEGFRFTYFHFSSSCIIWEHALILFLSSFWNYF